MSPKRGSAAGADEALASLVRQFSDPLAFLRELVQNSLDAASTQVDVTFTWQPGEAKKPGLMTVAVADNGEGMTEQVIDDYLLTLFRSSKENDLTKIGKFGVGFVSVFAIEPRLVVLETGQAGESWRLLLHPDGRYEKLRLDQPVEGTRVLLHKAVSAKAFEDLRQRGHRTVRYWCKFAEAAVRVDGELVGEAFELDAALLLRHQEPGTELLMGLARPADGEADTARAAGAEAAAALRTLVGFYNRGLTLVEGAQLPGAGCAELAGLSLRVKSRYLEHTLTRDNVRQDEHYLKVLSLAQDQLPALRAKLVDHLRALAARGGVDRAEPLQLEQALLYARLPGMRLHQTCADEPLFPSVEGAPLSFRQLRRMGQRLCAPGSNPVTRMLGADGVPVLLDRHGVVPHLQSCGLSVEQVNAVFHTAVPVETPPKGQELLAALRALLRRGRARVRRVVLAELDYPDSSVAGRLLIRQQRACALTRKGHHEWPGLLFGGARELVLGISHPLVQACLRLAEQDSTLAAHLLAQGVATAEQLAPARKLRLAAAALSAARSAGGAQ